MFRSFLMCFVLIVSLAVSASTVLDERIAESIFVARDPDYYTMTVRGSGPMPDFKQQEGLFRFEIREFSIEEGVTTAGAYSFGDGRISALTTVWMANSVTSINQYAFYGQANLKSVRLSGNLKAIGEGAFLNTGLTSVEIPETVKVLGSEAFRGCTSLKSVTFMGIEPPAVSNPDDIGGLDASVQVYIQPGVDPAPFKALGFQKVNEADVVLVWQKEDIADVLARNKAGECVIARLPKCFSCPELEVPRSVSLTIDLNGFVFNCEKLKVNGTLQLKDTGRGMGYMRPGVTQIGRQGSIRLDYGPLRTTITYFNQGLVLLFK